MPTSGAGKAHKSRLRLVAVGGEALPNAPMQRSQGAVRISFKPSGGGTVLHDLYQQGCLKARLPKQTKPDHEAVLINTAGGLTGGDALSINVAWQPETRAAITTQACERIYRSSGEDAVIASRLTIGEDATACWLPQETILFEGARLDRRTHASLSKKSTLIACEAVIIGRPAMGEYVHTATLRDEWIIERDGKIAFIDRLQLAGDVSALLDKTVIAKGARAFASVITAGPDTARHCDLARKIIDGHDVIGGSSDLDGVSLTRILAPSGHELRKVVLPVLAALCGSDLPRVWTC
ncbi:MAG: urease accessory protein UreD [Pseudomonadota bacterium]